MNAEKEANMLKSYADSLPNSIDLVMRLVEERGDLDIVDKNVRHLSRMLINKKVVDLLDEETVTLAEQAVVTGREYIKTNN